MALNPSAQWPGRVTPAVPAYPYGSGKNETAEGADDGTPYDKAFGDDIFGLHQALLKRTGIVPSGVADTADVSQYLEAMTRIMGQTSQGGCPVSNDGGDPDHNIQVNAGSFFSEGPFPLPITLTASIIKQLNNTFVVGTGNGGMAAGAALAPNEEYPVFLVGSSTNYLLADICADDNEAGSNLAVDPNIVSAGLNLKIRIGYVLTDGASNIIPWSRNGDRNTYLWDVPQVDFNGFSDSNAQNIQITAPRFSKAHVKLSGNSNGGTDNLLITSLAQANTNPTNSINDLRLSPTSERGDIFRLIRANSARNIRLRGNVGGAVTAADIITYGWEDDLTINKTT